MLKILFGLLVLINGGLFAFHQGYLDAWNPAGHEPSRLTQQLNADKLKLISPTAARPVAESAASSAAPSAAPSIAPPVAVAAAPAKNPVSADKIADVPACTEVGNFDVADAKRFETQLATLSLGERLTRRPIQQNVQSIVYIPSLANKEAADKKIDELKKLGIKDFFVIQDHSALQWGISLGVFKSEEAARNHLAALTKRGVHSARIGTYGGAENKVAFQLRGLDASTKNSVEKIKENFPHQEWRECASPAAA
jgi:hypothetical protein